MINVLLMIIILNTQQQATDFASTVHAYLVENRQGYNADCWSGINKHKSLDKWYVKIPDDCDLLPSGIIEQVQTPDVREYVKAWRIGGKVYYVKNGGADSANGLTNDTAWAHHPWMIGWTGSVVLAAGDTVFLNRGDSWVYSGPSNSFITIAQSGTQWQRITLGAYGTGNKPILYYDTEDLGSSVIYAEAKANIIIDGIEIKQYSSAFNEAGGSYGIWLNSVCHDFIIINCDIHEIPHSCIYAGADSYNITIGNLYTDSCADSENYSNHFYNWGYAGAMLLGTNPETNITNNKVYYNYIHASTRINDGDNVYGISFSVQASNSSNWPSYCWAVYNYIADIKTWHGVDTHGGNHLYFQKNNFKDIGLHAVHILSADYSEFGDLSPMLNDIYVEGNTVEIDPDKVQPAVTAQITIFGNVSLSASNINVKDNTCFYTVRPTEAISMSMIAIINTDGAVISGNIIYNGPTVSSNTGAIMLLVGCKNITIEENEIDDYYYGINWRGGDSVIGSVIIRNNILTNSGIGFVISDLISSANIEIYDNQFKNFRTIEDILEGAILIIRDNIIASDSYVVELAGIAGNLTIDNNHYECSLAKPVKVVSAEYTFSQWQGLGYDIHSDIT